MAPPMAPVVSPMTHHVSPVNTNTYAPPISSTMDIPSAPSFSVYGQAAVTAVSSAASQVMSALAPSAPAQHQYPAGQNNLGASRAPPINNADPRVKDTVELCNFAIAALKVRFFMLLLICRSIDSSYICCLYIQHNEIALARDRLQEALKRLG